MKSNNRDIVVRMAKAVKRLKELQRAERCEERLIDFVEYVWPVVEPAIPFIRGWVIEAIAEHLEAVTYGHIKRLLINVPPGFTKSLMTDVFWPAWEWGPRNMPWLRYVCASYSNHLTERDNMRCRNIVVNDRYRKLWGSRFGISNEQFTKIKFANDKTGWKLATSVGGIGVGERADRFICFPHDEVVHTERGLMRIGDIVERKEKIRVLSFDVETGLALYRPVSGWHKNPQSRLLRLTLSDGSSIRCTPSHRFWSRGRWIPASELIPYSSLSVCGEPKSFSDRCPNTTGTDSVDSSCANAISFSKDVSWFCSIASYFTRLFSRQNGVRAIFKERKRSVTLGVRDILRPRSVFEIIRSIILWVSIFVSDIPRWMRSGAMECSSYDDVTLKVEGHSVPAKIDAKISLLPARSLETLPNWLFQYPFLCCARSYETVNFAREATNPTVAGRLIEWESRNTAPDLYVVSVGDGGHADNTYCLTVEDTHTFCVGGTQAIIVGNCDDANNTMEMESEVVRQTTNMWFTEVVPDRLNNQSDSAIVVIQQRLHEEDVSGTALSRDMGYTHLCVPMLHEVDRHCVTVLGIDDSGEEIVWEDPRQEDGELAWPERFPADVVEQLKNDKGQYAFAGQYQQSPVPRGGAILHADHWKLWEQPKYPAFEFLLGVLDTAYTEKQENDPSAQIILGVFRDENRNAKVMLIYAWKARFAFTDLVNKVIDVCTVDDREINFKGEPINHPRFPIDRLVIENKAAGISVAQEIHRAVSVSGRFGVELFDPRRYGDKVARAHSVEHMLREGMVYAPDKSWAQMVIDECATFPKGSHDDLVDCLTMGLRYLRDQGLLLRREEQAVDDAEELAYRSRTKALYEV